MTSAFGDVIVTRPDQAPYSERRVWQTDIFEYTEGGEAREQFLDAPIYVVSLTIKAMAEIIRQYIDSFLMHGLENTIVVPLWLSERSFTDDRAGREFSVTDMTNMEFTVGRLVCFINSAGRFDVRTIEVASGTTLRVDSALDETYEYGDLVLPCIAGYVKNRPTAEALADNLSQISLVVMEL